MSENIQIIDILEYSPDGMFTIGTDLIINYVNPSFCNLLGFTRDEILGTSISSYLGDLSILNSCMANVQATGHCNDQETIFKRKDGSIVHISKNVQALYDQKRNIKNILVSIRDMTPLHQLNKELRESKSALQNHTINLETLVKDRTKTLNEQMLFLKEYKKAIDISSIVSKSTLDKKMGTINSAMSLISGYESMELLGQSFTSTWQSTPETVEEMWQIVSEGKSWRGIVANISKNKTVYHLDQTVIPIHTVDGTIVEYIGIGYDVTELVDKTKRLTERLHYDILTKLPNRTKLLSDIGDIHSPVTIILLNVDSFKEVNTFYGHEIGDNLLLSLGDELVNFSKKMGISIVYKLPVDEYAILIKGLHTKKEIEIFITDLSHFISNKNFKIAEQEISLNITIGIAASNINNGFCEDQQEILGRADMALKLAKKTRKNHIFYDESLHIKEDYENNLLWIKKLRNAIDEDRVIPFYQPIVNSQTLLVEKYEALVRIIQEDGTIIPPNQFLAISKKVKLYHQITTIMIDKVIDEFRHHPTKSCSINLSIEDINDLFMSSYIIDKVRNCPYAERIILEILESEGIENYDTVHTFIKEVKRYGVKIAIDDFGAGYSNFAYIMKLDVDFIKIDGSIIRDIDHNRSSQIIAQTIVDFAAKLNIQTVAEFVTGENVYDYVKNLSISHLQGYYFGEPSRSIKLFGSALE